MSERALWRPCRDDSENAALPAVGFGPVLRREEGVRCKVHRLQCSAVYKPLLARAGGDLPHPLLFVSLRPARWTGNSPAHTLLQLCDSPLLDRGQQAG